MNQNTLEWLVLGIAVFVIFTASIQYINRVDASTSHPKIKIQRSPCSCIPGLNLKPTV